jgi:hypothetical protein
MNASLLVTKVTSGATRPLAVELHLFNMLTRYVDEHLGPRP